MTCETFKGEVFNKECVQCPRLASFLATVRDTHSTYYAHPVPLFGDAKARLLIVGLAPGMHGANRTGRPFTGDFAGILLYETLYKYGYGNRVGTADPSDGLVLTDCRITNAVKCLPPANKPNSDEIKRCNQYLAAELATYPPRAVLALGRIAHDAVLMSFGLKASGYRFGHHAVHDLPNGLRLYDSYHCSRYNTQTRRLTAAMFDAVFADIAAYLDRPTKG